MGRGENTFSLRDSVFTPPSILDPVQEILGPIGLDPCSHPHSIVPARLRYYLPEYAPPGMPHGEPLHVPSFPHTLVHTRVDKYGKEHVTRTPIVVPAHLAVVGDGLDLPWGPGLGLTFLNPPYSKLSEQPWFLRALGLLESHEVRSIPSKGERKRTAPTQAHPNEVVWFVPVRTAGSWWQTDVVNVADAITFLRFRVQHVGEPDPSPFHQCLVYRGPRADLWREKATKLLGWTITGGTF